MRNLLSLRSHTKIFHVNQLPIGKQYHCKDLLQNYDSATKNINLWILMIVCYCIVPTFGSSMLNGIPGLIHRMHVHQLKPLISGCLILKRLRSGNSFTMYHTLLPRYLPRLKDFSKIEMVTLMILRCVFTLEFSAYQ